jgi:hypothetical protein
MNVHVNNNGIVHITAASVYSILCSSPQNPARLVSQPTVLIP